MTVWAGGDLKGQCRLLATEILDFKKAVFESFGPEEVLPFGDEECVLADLFG